MQYAEALLQRAAKHRCINAYAHVENYQASIHALTRRSQVAGCPARIALGLTCCLSLPYAQVLLVQVLKEARAIDERFEAGEDIRPLCGLAFVVKDNLDVLGGLPVAQCLAVWVIRALRLCRP